MPARAPSVVQPGPPSLSGCVKMRGFRGAGLALKMATGRAMRMQFMARGSIQELGNGMRAHGRDKSFDPSAHMAVTKTTGHQ